MSILYTCPLGTAIQSQLFTDCPEQIGQIQKLIVQRAYASAGARNQFTIASANPNVIASWTPLLTALDATKAQITDWVESPTVTPGDAQTVGGGNDSLNGVEQIIAKDPTVVEVMLYQKDQATIKALKDLASETLQVYFVNEHGKIIGETDDHTSPTIFRGFLIEPKSWFVGDKSFGGYNERDSNSLRFSMSADWSDLLHVVTPSDFNAKDLTNS